MMHFGEMSQKFSPGIPFGLDASRCYMDCLGRHHIDQGLNFRDGLDEEG